MVSVDNARTILEKVFGNPLTHLNFQLGVMKSTQPLSDKSIETDPNKAAIWFLQYEKAIYRIHPEVGRQIQHVRDAML